MGKSSKSSVERSFFLYLLFITRRRPSPFMVVGNVTKDGIGGQRPIRMPWQTFAISREMVSFRSFTMSTQSLMAFFLAYVPEPMGSRLVRLGRTIKTKAWGKPSKIPVLRTAVSLDIARTCQAATSGHEIFGERSFLAWFV